jgi:predicted amidohydrolase YtcJ
MVVHNGSADLVLVGGSVMTMDAARPTARVVDRDIAGEPTNRLGDARVLLTLIEGVPVHEDPELERP